MLSGVILRTKGYKPNVGVCCRLLNTRAERQPLKISALRYNATEKKYIINDTESKLICFFGDDFNLQDNEVPEIKRELVPKKYFTLKNSNSIKYSFTVDDKIAEKIGNVINPYIKEDDIVLEANPGLGLITDQLLKSRAKKIYVFQKEDLMPSLRDLIKSNTEKLDYLPGKMYHNNLYNGFTSDLTNYIQKCEGKGQKFKIVSVLHEKSIFTNLCKMVAYGNRQFFYDDVEFFVIVNPTVQKALSSSYKLRWHSYVIFKSLMNFETLCELPRESFLPWSKKKEDCMFLCKISKNLKAFDVVKRDDYHNFLKFLKLLGRRKQDHIIPTLEHYSPGCGAELIKLGIATTWTKVTDLSPAQTASLYKTFQATPGYVNYKMVTSNEHRGFVEIEDIQDNKLENEMHDIEDLGNFVAIT